MSPLKQYFANDRRKHSAASKVNPNHIIVDKAWVGRSGDPDAAFDAHVDGADPGEGLFDALDAHGGE